MQNTGSGQVPSLLHSILRGYVWMIALLAVGITAVVFTTLRSASRERAMEDLTRSAYALVPVVQSYITDSTSAALNSLVNEVATTMDTRITVINRDGSVVADSEKDPDEMENHRTRIEVIAAFNGVPGRSVRFSKTLGREMLYTAVPVVFGDSITAVVRTSLFFDSYSAALQPVVKEMLLIILTALVVAVISGWIISRRIADPMSDLASVADRVRRGELGARAAPGHTREHNSLALSLNETLARNENLILDLSRSDSRNRAILESMIEGVAVVNRDGDLLVANDSFRDLFNTGSSEIKVPAELAELFSQSSLPSSGIVEFEGKIVAFSSAEVSDSGDYVFSFRDVTAEVHLSEMKKDFITNVSHELRTPLTAIKGYAETLQEDTSGESSDYLKIILRNTERLIALVKDIQTLSEVEGEEGTCREESVSVSDILDTVLPLFTSRAMDKGITITADQITPNLTVSADHHRIEQVFVNLIDNAVKYTDSGLIQISAAKKGNQAVFAVSDTGRGIPREAIPRVFERFYVVDRSRSRKMGGTGLGLAITKHIVEGCGGTISVSSTPGQGSIFLFTLPLATS